MGSGGKNAVIAGKKLWAAMCVSFLKGTGEVCEMLRWKRGNAAIAFDKPGSSARKTFPPACWRCRYNPPVNITRRNLMSGAAAILGASALVQTPSAQNSTSELRIDAARLQKHLEELSVFGRPAGGTFADGVSRVAYSDADLAGRTYAMGLMREAGLDPRVDAAETFSAAAPAAMLRSSRSCLARTLIRCRAAETLTAISDRSRRSRLFALSRNVG